MTIKLSVADVVSTTASIVGACFLYVGLNKINSYKSSFASVFLDYNYNLPLLISVGLFGLAAGVSIGYALKRK